MYIILEDTNKDELITAMEAAAGSGYGLVGGVDVEQLMPGGAAFLYTVAMATGGGV